MPEVPRERLCAFRRLRVLVPCLVAMLFAACGGGTGGNGNDGQFVGRTGVVISGVVDDGTVTSPVAGGSCRLVDLAGNVLDTSSTEADGSYLLLLEPGQLAFVVCAASGQSALALRTFVSTVGLPEGGELPGQDVLPATTMLARIVAAEAADDPAVDAAARLAALAATLQPFGSDAPPVDADLQLLADAATIAYDALRDAGEDLDFDAFLTDLYDDGELDFYGDAAAATAIETAVAERAAALGRDLPDAVLATHPAFEFTVLNVGGARSTLDEIARLATLIDEARLASGDRAVLTLSPGDVLSPGVSLIAGLETQDPFFDSLAFDALAVDAFGIGAEDLELGPPTYGTFLARLTGDSIGVLTDIDTSLEPNAFLVEAAERSTAALRLERNARLLGIVAATSADFEEVTSTRLLRTFPGDARIERIQSGIDTLQAAGARLLVLLASERSEASLAALVAELSEVDLVVALPGVPSVDAAFAGEGPRPIALTSVVDADGRSLPVIPGVGNHEGFVEATLRADPLGRLDANASTGQLRRVAGADEAVPTAEDPEVAGTVSEPLADAIASVRDGAAGQNEVALDPRPETIFEEDSNWAALVADAALATSRGQVAAYRSVAPNISMVDAGSIDSAAELPAGSLTRGELFDLVDAGQVVGVLQRVTPAELERLLEFSFANRGTGLFAQYGGLFVTFDPDGTAQVLDADGSVLVAGTRVVDARIGDTFLIQDGAAVATAPTISIAISERVRDAYPLAGLDLINVGVTVAQSLDAYVRNTLRGTIPADLFPVGGGGRIEIADGG